MIAIQKNHVIGNLTLKSCITVLLRQFTKTLDQFLNLSRVNKHF